MLYFFYNGTPVNVISQADGWCYVVVGGLNGYFRAEFYRLPAAATPARPLSMAMAGVNMHWPSYAYNGLAAKPRHHGHRAQRHAFWQISRQHVA